ncbi:sensor histidine kinase [Agromyces sp. GXQ0307]|uniref:sensor histidine kinase n=1 Tax=Agromyces sp. GXQ0307 TaxID=3377835 RepID=UPI00383BD546
MTLASSRIATVVALSVSALAAIGAIAIDLAVLPAHPRPPLSPGWSGVLPGLAMLVPGALLLWRLAWHPIAVVLTAFGTLWVLDGLASAAVNLAWYGDRDAWWAVPAMWFFGRLGSVLILPIQLLLLLFPDGRLRQGGWRVVSVVAIVLGLVMPFAFLFAPNSALVADDPDRAALLEQFDPALPTLAIPDAAWSVLLGLALPCMAASLVLALVVCVSRRFGATAEERAQLRWLVWSGGVFVAALPIYPLVPTVVVDLMLGVTIGLISGSIVIAVTRYRLYAIDRLLSWTLVYAVLIAAIVAVDVIVVLLVGSAIDDRVAMLLAVVAVTVAYAPLRGRLFAIASRAVSGRRGDPYGVVSSLGERLEAAETASDQLTALAAAVSEAFASPYVRVELDRPDGDHHSASVGATAPNLVDVPIRHRGAAIGRVLMEPGRRPVVSERDQRLLGDLVRLAAAAILDGELRAELQASRERLVLAREEERSRLRRDLHDGLGPLLAGVKLRLETARNLAERDPARSLDLVDAAIADQSEVISEIRRIVHDLRPPALDDLGLVRAIEQHADRLTGAGLVIAVHAPDDPRALGDLAPAVEVAAYRIAAEALANVRRHSAAATADVRIDADATTLRLEIRDTGTGIPDDAVRGVGLRSVHERAAEVGGTLDVATDASGTTIRAVLPLARSTGGPDRSPDRSRTPEAAADAR